MPTSTSGSYAQLLKKRGFAYLLGAQALAVFDDNNFRQLLLLYITARAVSFATRNLVIFLGTVLYVLPYVLFSSYTGQVADRYSKRAVIIAMKSIEAGLLALATLAMFVGPVPGMLVVVFLLGIHAACLDPAKEGILPQIFPEEGLSRANGLMQLTVYIMIVLGPVAAGFLLDVFSSRPFLAVAFLVGTALIGLVLALGITRVPPCAPEEPFRWNGWAEFLRDFGEIRASRPLFLTVLAITYFWFMGAVYLQNVVGYGHDLLHLREAGISTLTAAVSLGIGLGALLAGRLSSDQVELGLVPIGSIGLGVFGIVLYFAHHSYAYALAGHFLLGMSGGIFIIPLQAFLQARAGEQSKGRVIAAANVLIFTGVILGGVIFYLLTIFFMLQPHQLLLVMGGLSFVATAYILTVLPDFAVRLCLWSLTHTFYRIGVRGAENLPRRGPALLVCNHVSFADPFLIGACTQRFIRFLMHRAFYEAFGVHWLVKLMGAIPISDADKPRQLIESLREAQQRLRDGDLVCIFAEGAITRTGNLLRFRTGFERILRGMSVPIIPVHLDRVWGSIFSFERGRFLFKLPRRIPYPVTVTFGPPLPATATAFEVRQAVMHLGADAFARRDATRRGLADLFLDAAKRNWWRFAMADSSGRELNYGRTLAGTLLFRRLIGQRCPGEKIVGVLLPPSVPTALLNLGISMAGRVPVNLNYTSSEASLVVAAERCGIKTIFTSEKLLERFSIPRIPGMVMIEEVAGIFTTADRLKSLLTAYLVPLFILRRWLLSADVALDSLATVIFSSGSTGVPKGVMLSHRNIASNVEGMQQAINVNQRDCLLGILPFFHSFGFTVGLWFPLLSGCGVVFHANPLEGRKVGELCGKYRVTILVSTPTFAWEYVRRCAPEEFASLRLAIVGAEKMKPELAEAFKKKFGTDIFEGYGCTELSPVVSVATPGYTSADHQQVGYKQGTVGHPIPGVAARILETETGRELGPNQEGMLEIRGAGVMMGYWGEVEKTREVVTEDGWYVTGDIARLDEDGFLTITDRLARFSKIAGEMVPHLQVEDALQRALGGEERKFIVTSVADEQKGEKLVVLYTDMGVSVDELLMRLRDSQLPKLWVPRKTNFFQIENLPLLGSGKLDLKQIKDTARRLAASQAAQTGEAAS